MVEAHSLKRSKMSLAMSLFVVVAAFSNSVKADVAVEGLKNVEVRVNEEFTLSCSTQVDIRFCSFAHKESTYIMDQDITYEGRISYFGNDPKKECGIKVKNVEDKDHGEWKCNVIVPTDEGTKTGEGVAFVTVLKAPESVYIEPSGMLSTVYPQDSEQMVSCSADGGRSEPSFKWMIGDQPISLEVTNTDRVENPDGTLNVRQEVKYVSKPEHNGKELVCVVESQAYYQTDLERKVNVANLALDILYKPIVNEDQNVHYGMRIGEEFPIRIGLTANPKPQITWKMHDGETVAEGSESLNGRYASEILESGPMGDDGAYTAVLTIKNVQEQDSESSNTLIISNDQGVSEFAFKLGMGEEPRSDRDGNTQVEGLENAEAGVGAIVVVIVIVILIVVVVAAAVIAKARGLLCFAVGKQREEDKEKAVPKEEGSDTESADQTEPSSPQETETDASATANRGQNKKSIQDRMTGLLSAMRQTVSPGRKSAGQDLEQGGEENKEADSNDNTDTEAVSVASGHPNGDIVYADLDKSQMTPSERDVVDTDKTQYADILPK